MQQQPQAQVFDVPLLAVDVPIQRRDPPGEGGVPLRQRLRGQGDDLLAQSAHLDQLPVELRQLLVKLTAHYPNLPVM